MRLGHLLIKYSYQVVVWTVGVVLFLLLSACAVAPPKPAPIVDGWSQPQAKANGYVVREGDTLYSIAWSFGLDYRGLAEANNLKPPYDISPGQRLTMNVNEQEQRPSSEEPIATPSVAPEKPTQATSKPAKKAIKKPVYVGPVRNWRWPAQGKVIAGFSSRQAGNKGVNIGGRLGEAIQASASGNVVYAGTGVRGYGNLIIIKHNASYLSAYAYNQKILVKEGQRVSQGQVIARMGRSTGGKAMLHFEIRRNGKPVNPLNYLSKT